LNNCEDLDLTVLQVSSFMNSLQDSKSHVTTLILPRHLSSLTKALQAPPSHWHWEGATLNSCHILAPSCRARLVVVTVVSQPYLSTEGSTVVGIVLALS